MSRSSNGKARSSKFSRRTFLKTAGAGAAVSGLASAPPSESAPVVLGPHATPLSLRINGHSHSVSVEPRVTLLRALRNQLDMTGAKEVCGRGACGACTVLIDGAPICSCMMLAADAEGHEITTIEGVGSPEEMSPLQQAFVECDALQCGFCTPGFVLAGEALLKENVAPGLAEIKHALSGNLCRCGTYPRIFEAVQKAAKQGAR